MYTKSSSSPLVLPYSRTSDGGFGPVTSRGTVTGTIGWSKTGSSLNQWRQLVRNGQSAVQTMSATRSTVSAKPGYAFASQRRIVPNPLAVNYSANTVEGFNFIATPTASTIDSAAADSQALQKLYRRIREDQTAFHGMTFLGELRESVRMVRSRGKQLFGDLFRYHSSQAKLKRRTKRERLREALSENWLEWSFGWAPLFSDIASASNAYIRFLTEQRRKRIRANGHSEALIQTLTEQSAINNIWYFGNRSIVDTVDVWYTVGIRADLARAAEGTAARLVELSGFKTSEFIPTVYELIPWSFMVDYFTNMGDLVSSACTDTSSVYFVSRAVVKKRTQKYDSVIDWPKTWSSWLGAGFRASNQVGSTLGSYESVHTSFERTAPSLGLPSLEFKLPGLGTKFINLSALASLRSLK